MNLPNNNTPYEKVSFSARCPQIRDAQWVCHVTQTVLPHHSTSKFLPLYNRVCAHSKRILGFEAPAKSIISISAVLDDCMLSKQDLKKLPFLKRIKKQLKFFLLPKEDKRKLKQLIAIRKDIKALGIARYECMGEAPKIYQILRLLEEYKLGNCLEDASLAELILKMNGIKNAETVCLSDKRNLDICYDHAVCIFNKDGSPFEGNITKHTIIIDPWCGVADFAQNIKHYYNNMMQKYLELPPVKQMFFTKYGNIQIDQNALDELKHRFPQFIFKNKNRGFMQN